MPTQKQVKEKVLVIGSGIGGLSLGIILARLGFDVTIIEKNRQPGGMMRSYLRRGVQCNVGLHYMGALDHGQVLRRCFDFLEITEQLPLIRMGATGRWTAISSPTTILASIASMCPPVLRLTKPG
jgi:all-trans-retinol 13,14-reductase